MRPVHRSGSGKVGSILQNIAGGVASAVPAYAATAYNTCSYTSTNTDPLCMDLNGALYVHISPSSAGLGTAGTPSTSVHTVQGSTASGSALASYPVLVAGSDGTDVRNLATNSTGHAELGPTTTIIGNVRVDQTTDGTTNGVRQTTQYPSGAVAETVTATGTTAATTATLATNTGQTTYICGFSIRANATAAATGEATMTGVITATMDFLQWTAPLASGIGVTEEIFSPCLPASTTNTSIAVVSAAPGAGGTVSVSAWGYLK